MVRHHSPVATAAYIDLLRSLQDEALTDLRGTPTLFRARNGRAYWYDSYRIGSDVQKIYLGEDTNDLRDSLARMASTKDDREARREYRARLIRVLRAEGHLKIDAGNGSLLNSLARAGVFRLGGTIVGTHAFRLYEGELGIRYGLDETAQTNDLDIASFERLSLALDDVVSERLQKVLSEFAFEPIPSLEPDKIWRWQQTRSETLVEFLTPSFEADEGLRPLAALGVHAQALHYLDYLIAEPIKAAVPYRNGVLVQIPRPERFAIHKLIVADRRREGADSLKSRKDRRQAEFLIQALAEERPDDLREAYQEAVMRGPGWRKRLERSLGKSKVSVDGLTSIGALSR